MPENLSQFNDFNFPLDNLDSPDLDNGETAEALPLEVAEAPLSLESPNPLPHTNPLITNHLENLAIHRGLSDDSDNPIHLSHDVLWQKPFNRPVFVSLAKTSLTPADIPSDPSNAPEPRRTGIYFECPQSLIDAMNIKLKKLKSLNKRNLGYSISKRDLFINFLINWLNEPVVLLRKSDQTDLPGYDRPIIRKTRKHPSPEELDADLDFNELSETIDEGEVGPRLNQSSPEMDEFLAEGGSVLELLTQDSPIISPVLPDSVINMGTLPAQISNFNGENAAITTDPLGNSLNLNNLDRQLLKIRKGRTIKLHAIPAGHVQKLFPAALEIIDAPIDAYYLDEGGNFYDKRGQVWDGLDNRYLFALGSAQWQYTIWRAWLQGWRPTIWTPRFDEVIADVKGLISPIELKEALKLSPITESIKESWTRNYLTITARPMDNTLALHTFITDFQALKEELENMDSWIGPYTSAKPQTPNQHFQYPEWVLRSYKMNNQNKSKKETQS